MSNVDDRVVNMKFNNSAFERGVALTLNTLTKLKNSLSFKAKDPLADVEKSSSHFSLNGVTTAIDGLTKKFGAMSTVGIAAIASITTKAVSAGLQLAKSLTIAPIMDGFHEYETQLGSIQTILANTGLKGAKGLQQVNATLNDLNHYSDKTIYNFTEMARNIGTFTAAGVKLKPAADAIKGIANLAALSGSNADQASTAMYQLSQAIANNKVGLQDWNSVVNAGMGGQVFQKALFNTAKQLHTIKGVGMDVTFEQWKKSGNSFRDSLKDGWINGKVLTQTLSQFTGDLTDAQLKAMGYNKDQIKEIQQQAKVAQEAATKVKTLSQLMDTLKEAVGSGWSKTFQLIFGNFNEARDLFTDVSNTLGGFISQSSNARNKVLSDWKAMGGRTALIKGIANAFHALMDILKPIKDAFRDIFPATTGKDLYNLTVQFRDFTKSLKIGPKTAEDLKRTFRGFFAILDIGKQVVSGIFHVIATLFSTVTSGAGGFLNLTGNIGDFLVSLDKAIKKGGGLTAFFDKLAQVLVVPLQLISSFRQFIFGLFDGFSQKDANGLSTSLGRIGDRLTSLTSAGDKIKAFFSNIWKAIQPGVQAIVQAFSGIGDAIAKAFQSGNFNQVFDLLNTGLLAGIALMIRKFFKSGLSIDVGGGIFGKLGDVFEGLTGNLKAMQQETKANTLLKIAGAVGILTVSVVALSMIDSKKLTMALKAMAVGFAELLGAMSILTKISGSAGFIKVPIIAASMDLLAGAILLLTVAVRSLAKLSWKQLQKGLTAVGLLLAGISAASIPLSANSAGLVRAGIGITAIAVAMNLLYFAVKDFAKLSWGELLKGMSAVAGSLIAIAAAARLMPKNMVLLGAGLIEISIALNAIYFAMKSFSQLSWMEMLKGLAGVAGSLVAIAAAMHLMPKGMIFQAAALVILGGALNVIAKAVASMSKLSWKEIGRGLAVLAGTMAILVVALNALDGALPGAAAMLIVSGALFVLSKVLKTMASMSWGDIVKGLIALAGAFAVIGIAGYLLAPVAPALLALGAAMLLLGAGFALFGAGALAVATAMGILAAGGSAAIALLLKAIEGIIKMLPELGKNLALGLTSFIVEIGKQAPKIIDSLVKLLGQLLDAVVKLAPKMGDAFTALLKVILKVIRDNFPDIVRTGLQMLEALLEGIKNNIGKVTQQAIDIIVRFLDTISKNMGRIIASGVNLLVKFLQGIANNLGKVISAAVSIITHFLNSIAGSIGKIIDSGANIVVQFVKGISRGLIHIVDAAVDAIIAFINAIGRNAVKLARAGAQALLDFIRGLTQAIKDYAPQLEQAGRDLGFAIADGLTGGLASKTRDIINSVGGAASAGLDAVKKVMKIKSPSRAMFAIGEYMMLGWANGIDSLHDHVVGKTTDVGSNTIKSMVKTMSGLSKVLASDVELNPTITPVLDLTQFRKDATQLNGITTTAPVTASVSYQQATDISTARQAAQSSDVTSTDAAAVGGVTLNFEQTNTSPKALSTVDIYRQTKNQLAQAKALLGVP